MSESMWWLDEAWWERKILPLGFVTLSFRELATVSLSFVAAFLASLSFEFPIAGVSFGGRATVFCLIFGTGCTVSSRRVKLLPVELQVLYLLRTKGIAKVRAILRNMPRSRKRKRHSSPESEQPPIVQEMAVEDFKNPISLVQFGRVTEGAQNGTRVLLFLGDRMRGKIRFLHRSRGTGYLTSLLPRTWERTPSPSSLKCRPGRSCRYICQSRERVWRSEPLPQGRGE